MNIYRIIPHSNVLMKMMFSCLEGEHGVVIVRIVIMVVLVKVEVGEVVAVVVAIPT